MFTPDQRRHMMENADAAHGRVLERTVPKKNDLPQRPSGPRDQAAWPFSSPKPGTLYSVAREQPISAKTAWGREEPEVPAAIPPGYRLDGGVWKQPRRQPHDG